MKDISEINNEIFKATSVQELMSQFPYITESISSESEYDKLGKVQFLPLNRLNSLAERSKCIQVISEVIESGCFTSGPFIAEIESHLCSFYKADTCIASSSGTDALKIALKAAGVSTGDEVILPLNSFAATENAVMAIGAKPVFANIDESYNMAPGEINRLKTSRTKAILPVCLYGSTKNLREIYHESKQQDMPVIVDAAQCFGVKSVIDHCDLMILSFNPFKNIGSFGKSGAVLTRSFKLARLARQYSYHGFAEGKKNIKAQDWGLNSRMDNMQAATLKVKLTHFEKNSAKRCFLAARYILSLRHLEAELKLSTETHENTWHLFPLYLKRKKRDELLQFAKVRNVELDIYYPVLSHCGSHEFAIHYPNHEQFIPSEHIHCSLIHLPLHNHMSLQEQDIVIEVLHAFFRS
ncbi:DegT/DnrJ/EryC1/StrS family aminotransferase [Photorhabdus khanii]|uniref:UDP-4-amino-4-deoxy-L-arabinose-oxoglutarate aminotransferase n=1 Tax=Photorhabdus khanii subsp. guanajuatensis TaxID=2100166 RepID=A0A4R4JII3_9GAMM|nr:DegT/DnrJ/EryC1/StrS family aminotransferase [Photorhabdus khanii]TDB52799.1 UDP-4-amino-4-deoxy-L-arabinose-oxoglutarate aminotransferase [Photorhabdus khanii subsp. guanajuatensis]